MKLISILLIFFFVSANGYSQVADCDQLAGSPFDPQKQTLGVGYDRLNAVLAIPACKNAVAESPQTARLWFQYGRALEKGNKLPDAISAYQEAGKLNSGAAYNNIGELYRDGKGFPKDFKKAEEYFVKAAELNSLEGKDNLLNLRKTTNLTPTLGATSPAPVQAPAPAPAKAPAQAPPTQKKAEMQEQAGKAIKVYKRREWVEGWSKYVTFLNIQSVTDQITISQVVLNRGRCQFYWVLTNRGGAKVPVQAQFGDIVRIDLDSPQCDLIEAEVTTNLGKTSYSF